MIFECADLAVASPATVSRCGMVYVQPDLLGWRPVMLSWLNTLPAGVNEAHKALIVSLFDWLLPPCLRVALKQVRSPLVMQDINLAISCMRLLACHLDPDFASEGASAVADLPEQQQATWIQCLFLFSLVWSVGGNTDEDGRRKFDVALRRLLANDPPADLKQWITGSALKLTTPFPEGGKLVYDFMFDKGRSKWIPWMDTVESKALDPEAEYSTIIVPTMDTVRYAYLSHPPHSPHPSHHSHHGHGQVRVPLTPSTLPSHRAPGTRTSWTSLCSMGSTACLWDPRAPGRPST